MRDAFDDLPIGHLEDDEVLPEAADFFPHPGFLTIREVVAITSLSRSTIYRLMKLGKFPNSVPLLPNRRRVGWSERDVATWLEFPWWWEDPPF